MKLYVVQRDYPYEGMGAAEAVYFEFEVEKMRQDYPGIADYNDDGDFGRSHYTFVTVERS